MTYRTRSTRQLRSITGQLADHPARASTSRPQDCPPNPRRTRHEGSIPSQA
ncbi:hypothetical protein T261_4005 [Streptomyces lydicus]|nr:hypothetical protein T261_4005 [Streptomyces lydicus]